jgi:hypothetical protein
MFTHTSFIYTRGKEPGVAITLINYPRYPTSQEKIREQALELAQLLMDKFHQRRVSVVMTDETVMLEEDPE